MEKHKSTGNVYPSVMHSVWLQSILDGIERLNAIRDPIVWRNLCPKLINY